jgi:hypothetical protein
MPEEDIKNKEQVENKEKEKEEESDEERKDKELKHIMKDFIKDILITFPEKANTLDEHLRKIVCDEDEKEESFIFIKTYFKKVFPERFFDILYKNESIFSEDSEINTEFLPGMKFNEIWNSDISEKTQETIWKYLQLILLSIITNISSDESFGDTAKLFEAIDENEFKSKLEETIGQMGSLFDDNGAMPNMDDMPDMPDMPNMDDLSGINLENLPNPEEIHEHISGMLGGKLGKLAQEIAEETAKGLETNMEDASSMNDIFQKLFKDPTKLMDLVKNVGSKLDDKIKSGEIKESELIEEASNLIKNMKDMPGMGNLQSMLGKMGGTGGMPNMGGGKNAKINVNAMQAQMQQNLRKAKMRERLQAKQRKLDDEGKVNNDNSKEPMKELVFSTGEKVERSARKTGPVNNKKRKKKKKKK